MMKTNRKRILAALIAMVICLTLCQPLALAVKRQDGVTMLESSDWKIVTVSKKKAFNLSPQAFSDAYDSMMVGPAETQDDMYGLLLVDLERMEGTKSTKFSMEGCSIFITATGESLTKSKIRSVNLYMDLNDPYATTVLAGMIYAFHVYDTDTCSAVAKKVSNAIVSGKEKVTFTQGNLKYTILTYDNGSSEITVTPK